MTGLRLLVPREPGPLDGPLIHAGLDLCHLAVAAAVPRPIRYADVPTRPDMLMFTSASAVTALGRAAVARVQPRRVGVVGDATARAARRAGWNVDVVARGTGAELAQALGSLEGAVVWWPRAADPAPETAPALRRAGATVHETVAYDLFENSEIEVRLAELLPVDLWAALAPSTTLTVLRAFKALGETPPPVVAIGPTTAAAARSHGLDVRAVARTPDAHALAEAIASLR